MDFAAAGRTFLLLDRRMGEHLWLVLTDPDPVTNKVVIVAVVSAKSHTDGTVCLVKGDHPFVKHDTHVDYASATFRPASKLNGHIASGRAKLKSDLSPEILVKIRAGAVASSYTPNEVAEYCADIFGLKP